jgi:hypothetical protein
MMKFPALGVIHDKVEHAVSRNREAGLSQANMPRRGEYNTQKHKREKVTKLKTTSNFAHASEGSDAESKIEWRCCGVPHWETQQECTDELTDQVLVEHGTPGMLL